jgi:hypothetical protein
VVVKKLKWQVTIYRLIYKIRTQEMLLLKLTLVTKLLIGIIITTVFVQAQDGGEGLTIGFSQIGSESAWRTAFTDAVKAEAEARGINLLFSDLNKNKKIKLLPSVLGLPKVMWMPLF